MNRNIDSLYCPAANLIAYDGPQDHEKMQKTSGDVILEQDPSGNSYLHLILPADRINFLHGNNSGAGSFFNNHKTGGNKFFDFEDDDIGDPD